MDLLRLFKPKMFDKGPSINMGIKERIKVIPLFSPITTKHIHIKTLLHLDKVIKRTTLKKILSSSEC